MKIIAFPSSFRRFKAYLTIILLSSVFIFSGNASAQTNARVLTAVKRAVSSSGFSVATIGSWLSTSYIEGKSDHDMRLIKPQNLEGEAEIVRAWENARFEIREELIKEFGHKEAEEILKKTNLYPPGELMETVTGPHGAAERFRELGSVPNLAHQSGEKLGNEALKNASEGLYGQGAKTYQQSYEKSSGKLIYSDNGKVREGFIDITHDLEGRGVYTIEGTSNTATQWAEKLDEALKSKNPKSVTKYFERMKTDIEKAKSLAGINGNSGALDETMKKLSKYESEALKEACAPIKENLVKRLEGLSHYNKLTEEGRKNLLANEMKKAMAADEALQNAYMKAYNSKIFEDQSLVKVIKESLENTRFDSNLLRTFARTENPREVSAIINILESTETKWTNFRNKIAQMSEKVPVKFLAPAAIGFFAYLQAADMAGAAVKEDYEKVFSDILVNVGFAGSLGVGAMQMLVQSLLESAKEFGYDIALRQQDCEDLIAGLYEVKGREEVSGAEFSLERLVFEATDEKTVLSIVETQAYNATMRGLGDATKKVDETLKDKLYNKCSGCILRRWSEKRRDVINRAVRMSRDVYRKAKFSPLTVSIDPQDPVITIVAGKKTAVDVDISLNSPESSNIESDIKKLEDTIRWLGGKKPEYAALLVSSTCRWYWGDRLIDTKKNIGKDLFSYRISAPFANAGVYWLRAEFELEITVASAIDDLSLAAGKISKKLVRNLEFKVEVRTAEEKNEIRVAISGDSSVPFGETIKLAARTLPEDPGRPVSFEWRESGKTVEKSKELIISGKEPGRYYYSLILFDEKGNRLSCAEQAVDVIAMPEIKESPERIIETATMPVVPAGGNNETAAANSGPMETITVAPDASTLEISSLRNLHFQIKAPDCWGITYSKGGLEAGTNMNLNRHKAYMTIGDTPKKNPKKSSGNGAKGGTAIYYDSAEEEKDDGEYFVEAGMRIYIDNFKGGNDSGTPIIISDFKGTASESAGSGSESYSAKLLGPKGAGLYISYSIKWGSNDTFGIKEGNKYIEDHKTAARSELKNILASLAIADATKIVKFPYTGPAFGPGYNPPTDDYPADNAVQATKPGDEAKPAAVEPAGIKVGIVKTYPAVNKIKAGSGASFTAKVEGGKGNFTYRWQPHPEVAFSPFEGASSATSVRFEKPGKFKIWVEVLETIDKTMKTAGRSEQVEIEVEEPSLGISVSPGAVMVGEPVRATVTIAPPRPKEIDFRWELPANAKLIEEAKDKTSISFYLTDNKPAAVKVSGRSPVSGEPMGKTESIIKASMFTVSVTVLGTDGPKPKIWKEGKGLVEVDREYAVFQNVKLGTKVSPSAAKVPFKYEWSVNADSHFTGSSISDNVSINRSRVGECAAKVTVKNAEGITIGEGSGGFDVKISQEDLKKSADKGSEKKDGKDSKTAENEDKKKAEDDKKKLELEKEKETARDIDKMIKNVRDAMKLGNDEEAKKLSAEMIKKAADQIKSTPDKKEHYLGKLDELKTVIEDVRADRKKTENEKALNDEEKKAEDDIIRKVAMIQGLLGMDKPAEAKVLAEDAIKFAVERIKKVPEKKDFYTARLDEIKAAIENYKAKEKEKESEKEALEKSTQDQAARERASLEQAAQEKAAMEIAAQQQAAREKEALESAARQQAAEERSAAEKTSRNDAPIECVLVDDNKTRSPYAGYYEGEVVSPDIMGQGKKTVTKICAEIDFDGRMIAMEKKYYYLATVSGDGTITPVSIYECKDRSVMATPPGFRAENSFNANNSSFSGKCHWKIPELTTTLVYKWHLKKVSEFNGARKIADPFK